MIALLAWTWMSVASAQPALAVSLRVTEPVRSAQLTARGGTREPAVRFTNDGSLRVDTTGDDTWWAIVEPTDSDIRLVVSGTVDSLPLSLRDEVSLPEGAGELVHVAYEADRVGAKWVTRQVEAAELPSPPSGRARVGTVIASVVGILALAALVLVPARRRQS